jgi:hypothetical protein
MFNNQISHFIRRWRTHRKNKNNQRFTHMVLCLFHVPVIMNRLSPVTGILSSCSCSFKLNNRDTKLVGFGFELQRKERLKRKLKFVVSAELSKSFSVNLGLDSKVTLFLTLWILLDLFVYLVYFIRLYAPERNEFRCSYFPESKIKIIVWYQGTWKIFHAKIWWCIYRRNSRIS